LHCTHQCPLFHSAIPAYEAHFQAVSRCVRDSHTTVDGLLASPPLCQTPLVANDLTPVYMCKLLSYCPGAPSLTTDQVC
jgi:hypothetical protein